MKASALTTIRAVILLAAGADTEAAGNKRFLSLPQVGIKPSPGGPVPIPYPTICHAKKDCSGKPLPKSCSTSCKGKKDVGKPR